jgi:hypothetical protein
MRKLLAVVLILTGYAVGQATKMPQSPQPPTGQHMPAGNVTPASGQAGRYQIFFSPHARADVYLLDTETGRIWRPVTITNAKDTNLKGATPEVWLYQDRIDSEQEFLLWTASHSSPPPEAQPQ